MHCFKNAELVSEISIFDRAFHYGDGCFTTSRIRNGCIELEALHKARLELGCQKLNLTVNLQLLDETLAVLKHEVSEVSGTLKVVVSRGDGQRGYSLPDHDADLWVYFYPKALEDFNYELIDVGVLQQSIGLCMPNLVGVKSLNRLEQVLLKNEADKAGWIEGLVTDVQGAIVEGISSNCFILINDTWITPELRYNGVHGVMRTEILKRMQMQGIPCEKRVVDKDEISHIQSLFFCNALSPMKIVRKLDNVCLDTQASIDLFHLLSLNQIR
jgi:4-amino-4-deoxychorismate lyase